MSSRKFEVHSYPLRFHETAQGRRLRGYVRTRLLADQPEERVRQSVLQTLVDVYGYPESTLRAEEPVARKTADRARADILVELPARAVQEHAVSIDSPEPRSEPLSFPEALRRLKGQIGDSESESLIEVHETPANLSLLIDGKDVATRCLGFRARIDSIEAFLEPTVANPARPHPLRVRVLGYGMSDQEVAIAKRLGLPTLRPDRGVALELDWLQETMWWGKTLRLGGVLAERLPEVWGVVHVPHDAEFGLLVRLNLDEEQYGELFLRCLEGLPVCTRGGGRPALRERLDALTGGDRVLVVYPEADSGDEGGDWRAEQGTVVRADADTVTVDLDDSGQVVAHRRIVLGEPWLGGRIDQTEASTHQPRQAADDGEPRTLIVVECKAPKVALTAEVRKQGLGYAKKRSARYLVLTNGEDSEVLALGEDGATTQVDDIPDYEAAVSNRAHHVRRAESYEPQPVLPAEAPPGDALRFYARTADLACDVPESLYLPIIRLRDLGFAPSPLLKTPADAYGIALLEDLGVHFHAPETSAGGAARGYYRDFVARNPAGHELIVGFALRREIHFINHPKFPDQRGRQCLKVGISDSADYRMGLSAYLDTKTLRPHGDGGFTLWHSGVATAGRTRVSGADMRTFLRERCPELVGEHGVFLGRIPPGRPDSAQGLDLVARLLAYAVHRSELKDTRRSTRSRRK